MEPQQKSDFAKLCRQLRTEKRLKQREVAEKIGIAASTYGNVESSPYKVVGLDKVERLINFYDIRGSQLAADLRSSWERVPLSPYGEKQRKGWERRNRMRSKAKHHDRLMVSLVEVIGAFLPHIPDREVCACSFGAPACELCAALENLGLDGFASKDKTLDQLAKLADKLSTPDEMNGAAP